MLCKIRQRYIFAIPQTNDVNTTKDTRKRSQADNKGKEVHEKIQMDK